MQHTHCLQNVFVIIIDFRQIVHPNIFITKLLVCEYNCKLVLSRNFVFSLVLSWLFQVRFDSLNLITMYFHVRHHSLFFDSPFFFFFFSLIFDTLLLGFVSIQISFNLLFVYVQQFNSSFLKNFFSYCLKRP